VHGGSGRIADESEGNGSMINLSMLTKFPEVKSAIIADHRGMLLESAGHSDANQQASALGAMASAMAHAGEQLGAGPLQRFIVTGTATASIAIVAQDAIVGAFVDPNKPIATVEKILDTALQR